MRDLGDNLISALRHFRRHKFRTALAVFGMAASVASIVVLTTIADAMRRDRMAYFEEAGSRIAEAVLLSRRGLMREAEKPFYYSGPNRRRLGSDYNQYDDYEASQH